MFMNITKSNNICHFPKETSHCRDHGRRNKNQKENACEFFLYYPKMTVIMPLSTFLS